MSENQAAVLKKNRIVVALDTSARGRAALEAAVRLALATRAELEGLFVEDEDLVRLAGLPVAREVDVVSAAARQLQAVQMEDELRAAANEAQRVFANALQKLNLRWTFRIVRGTISQALLAAAGEVDLLVIGQRGRSSLVITGDYLPRRSAHSHRVVAVFDGSQSAFRAIELANSLAEPSGSAITVLVLANEGDQASQQCMAWLQQHGIRAEVNQILQPSEDAVVDYVRKYPLGVLLINRDSSFINESQIDRIVNEFDCPLVLC